MKNFKKALALVLIVALAMSAGVLGTIAYLTYEDSDVNVMTMGEVKIDQLEYERVVENGAWVSTGETDKYGYTPDKVQPFTQHKPLLPAVFADGNIKWDDRNGSEDASGATSHQQSWGQVGASGSNQLFDSSVKNVQDKFVFVKNTGKTNAYVRTWIALEQGSIPAEEFQNVIMTNFNSNHWSRETVATDVVIGDSTYVIWCCTYMGPKSNPTGILTAGTVSYPSLLQVYMKPEADNAEVAAIDGNGNGTYEVLVFSQAVQAEGFENAETALTAAFGSEHPWNLTANDGKSLNNALNALQIKNIDLTDNVESTGATIEAGESAHIDLQDNTLTMKGDSFYVDGSLVLENGELNLTNFKWYVLFATNNADVTISDVDITTSAGGVNVQSGTKVVFESGSVTINSAETSQRHVFYAHGEGTEIVIEDGNFTIDAYRQRSYACALGGATIYIKGGTFGAAPNHPRWTHPIYEDGGEVIITGGTFGFDPTEWVAEGYVATQNGTTWTVSAQ